MFSRSSLFAVFPFRSTAVAIYLFAQRQTRIISAFTLNSKNLLVEFDADSRAVEEMAERWFSSCVICIFLAEGKYQNFSFHLNISEFSLRLQTWNSCEFSRRSIKEFVEKGIFEAIVLVVMERVLWQTFVESQKQFSSYLSWLFCRWFSNIFWEKAMERNMDKWITLTNSMIKMFIIVAEVRTYWVLFFFFQSESKYLDKVWNLPSAHWCDLISMEIFIFSTWS